MSEHCDPAPPSDGRPERLSHHLATEHGTKAQVLALAAKLSRLDRFQGQLGEQIIKDMTHKKISTIKSVIRVTNAMPEPQPKNKTPLRRAAFLFS